MIDIEFLRNYYPDRLWSNSNYKKYLIKEYIQLLILDYLSSTPYIRKIVFIGGTNIRLTKGIDRFSEDLDFDCKSLTREDFFRMTDSIILFLQRYGFRAEPRDKENDKLKAYRRNIFFPEMLFELGLSGYREERFLIKIESQDQNVNYEVKMATVKGCGLYFNFPVPVDSVLCSMKISALLSRQKGRDFYDVMFLMGQTAPDFKFLSLKHGINNMTELKDEFTMIVEKTDLKQKSKDFEHLVFDKRNAGKILKFSDFAEELTSE
jgi:predicted nucleotidyltransferase component of viral defense system